METRPCFLASNPRAVVGFLKVFDYHSFDFTGPVQRVAIFNLIWLAL